MPQPHLILFFTFDVSLKIWQETGLLSREVALYQRLVESGWKVTFATYGDAEDHEIAKHIHPIEVITLFGAKRPKSTMVRLFLSPLLVWKARKALKAADLYKTNQIWGGWNAVFSQILFKRPLIARGGYEPYSFSIFQKHSELRQWVTKITSKWAYRRANQIFMATQEDTEFVSDTFKISKEKIFIRSNWVDTEQFIPQTPSYDENHILFIGRMTRQKNLENLFQAITNSEYTLHLVGHGELEGDLKNLANKLNIKTIFHGRLPNNDLANFISQFHVFILPSLFEGNPKVLLEAMSCGRGIVATQVAGIEKLIEHGQNGLLCSTDAQSLRNTLDELCSNDELRKKLGTAARKHVEITSSLNAYVKDELEFYQRLIN